MKVQTKIAGPGVLRGITDAPVTPDVPFQEGLPNTIARKVPESLKLSPQGTMGDHWVSLPKRGPGGPGGVKKPMESLQPPARYTPPYGSLTEALRKAPVDPLRQQPYLAAKPPNNLTPEETKKATQSLRDLEAFTYKLRAQGYQPTPNQIKDLASQFIESASAHLSGTGIEHLVIYVPKMDSFQIQIAPEGDHKFSRLATSLRKSLQDLAMLYVPERIIQGGFTAAYVPAAHAVLLGHKALIDANPSDFFLGHEIRHAKNNKRAEFKKPSPYHGDAIPMRGKLPEATVDFYNTYQSMDEMDAYGHSVRSGIHELQRSIDRQNNNHINRDLNNLYSMVLYGTEVTVRSVTMAEQALEALDSKGIVSTGPMAGKVVSQLLPKFVTHKDGVVYAHLLIPHRQGEVYRLEMPLVNSRGPSDPTNATLLRDQLIWAQTAGNHHLTDYRLAQQVFDKILNKGGKPLGLVEISALIQALRPILTERNVALNPKFVPPTYKESVDMFNRNLEAVWKKKAA
jgi:hypothetical protein